MKDRHSTPRKLRKQWGFTWSRIVDQQLRTVTWRLFRRDQNGRCHMEAATFRNVECESAVARRLLTMRARLLDTVDRIDFEILGVTA